MKINNFLPSFHRQLTKEQVVVSILQAPLVEGVATWHIVSEAISTISGAPKRISQINTTSGWRWRGGVLQKTILPANIVCSQSLVCHHTNPNPPECTYYESKSITCARVDLIHFQETSEWGWRGGVLYKVSVLPPLRFDLRCVRSCPTCNFCSQASTQLENIVKKAGTTEEQKHQRLRSTFLMMR
jgi:hypothetical protein